MRLRTSTSAPNSASRTVSGRSRELPAVDGDSWPDALTAYVSYCAAKLGLPPAVPYDARSLNSLTWGKTQNGSSDTRQASEPRPYVAQRLSEPKSELPSRRTSPPMM